MERGHRAWTQLRIWLSPVSAGSIILVDRQTLSLLIIYHWKMLAEYMRKNYSHKETGVNWGLRKGQEIKWAWENMGRRWRLLKDFKQERDMIPLHQNYPGCWVANRLSGKTDSRTSSHSHWVTSRVKEKGFLNGALSLCCVQGETVQWAFWPKYPALFLLMSFFPLQSPFISTNQGLPPSLFPLPT